MSLDSPGRGTAAPTGQHPARSRRLIAASPRGTSRRTSPRGSWRGRRYVKVLALFGLAAALECVQGLVASSGPISLVAVSPAAPHRSSCFVSTGAAPPPSSQSPGLKKHRSPLRSTESPASAETLGNSVYFVIPLVIPNLLAMGVAFRRGWVIDPAILADGGGEQRWKAFLADREIPCHLHCHDVSRSLLPGSLA